jgi:hypothetical protein
MPRGACREVRAILEEPGAKIITVRARYTPPIDESIK